TIALGTQPITLAATLEETNRVPALDLVFDHGGHRAHVAGLAAGHNLVNVAGFDGVAPGAQLIGLKIANSARGGISVNGSMERAMIYAARFAEQRGLPLVLNLSFGVGNERGGRAVIDSIVNAFLERHPTVVFAISAGNDGPGLSTMGFPGSADLALPARARRHWGWRPCRSRERARSTRVQACPSSKRPIAGSSPLTRDPSTWSTRRTVPRRRTGGRDSPVPRTRSSCSACDTSRGCGR